MLVTIPNSQVKQCKNAPWIIDKVPYYSNSDGKSAEKVRGNCSQGMIGEYAAAWALKDIGIGCTKPNHGRIRGPIVWAQDMQTTPDIVLRGTNLGKIHSVKSQYSSMARETGLSWLWQLEDLTVTPVRHLDPMLADPSMKRLVFYVCLYDVVGDVDMKAEVRAFYWPDVSLILREPKRDYLKGKKKAQYFEDIKEYEIDLSSIAHE